MVNVTHFRLTDQFLAFLESFSQSIPRRVLGVDPSSLTSDLKVGDLLGSGKTAILFVDLLDIGDVAQCRTRGTKPRIEEVIEDIKTTKHLYICRGREADKVLSQRFRSKCPREGDMPKEMDQPFT